MKTALKYRVIKEEKYNYITGKNENHIVSRGFEFTVNGCRTEEEHNKIIGSFENFLTENNINYNSFGNGTWKDAMYYNDEKNFLYIDIPIEDMEEKENIKDLYKEWKEKIKRA